jgi:hypothetical protein
MPTDYLRCEEIAVRRNVAFLRQYEVPITHALSLPLPTMRHHSPGYLTFASPAQRAPDKPQIQGPPDRWWIHSALDGQLLSYNLCSETPLADGTVFATQELPAPAFGIAALKEAQSKLVSLLDILSPAFFRKESGDRMLRKRLTELLVTFLPIPLIPQYRAAVPDFFAWLEA